MKCILAASSPLFSQSNFLYHPEPPTSSDTSSYNCTYPYTDTHNLKKKKNFFKIKPKLQGRKGDYKITCKIRKKDKLKKIWPAK